MKVCFHASEKEREQVLADAFIRGCLEHGEDGVVCSRITPLECDVAVMVGVKSRELFHAYRESGTHVVMVDKGYLRHRAEGPLPVWEYWRVSVDSHHPTAILMKVPRPTDRLEKLRLDLKPWRDSGSEIVIAGSSAKYNEFYGLPDPTRYAKRLVRSLSRLTNRPIAYRPKPSWREAVPVPGTRFSRGKEPLAVLLESAHALVTHGSNACFEAIVAGVPCIILGDAVARPLSVTRLSRIENLRIPTEAERLQWLANLAYFQFRMDEFAAGEAWAVLKPLIEG